MRRYGFLKPVNPWISSAVCDHNQGRPDLRVADCKNNPSCSNIVVMLLPFHWVTNRWRQIQQQNTVQIFRQSFQVPVDESRGEGGWTEQNGVMSSATRFLHTDPPPETGGVCAQLNLICLEQRISNYHAVKVNEVDNINHAGVWLFRIGKHFGANCFWRFYSVMPSACECMWAKISVFPSSVFGLWGHVVRRLHTQGCIWSGMRPTPRAARSRW